MADKIVVFDDWETWSAVEGVRVCEVDTKAWRKLERGDYPKHIASVRKKAVFLTELLAQPSLDRLITYVEQLTPDQRKTLMWPYCSECGESVTVCKCERGAE